MKNLFSKKPLKKLQGFLILLLTLILIYPLWRLIEIAPERFGLEPFLKLNLRMAGGFFFLAFLLLVFTKIKRVLKIYLLLSALSLFAALSIAFLFKDSEYGFNVDWGDQGFLTSFLTKIKAFGFYSDVFYKDLPNFYPPLYYYVLALISKATGDEPFLMLRIGMVFAPAILIFLSFHLWKKIVSLEVAAVISFSLLVFQEWSKVNAWISLIIIIPWWIYYVENNFINPQSTDRFDFWHCVKGGIWGGIMMQLQYYWLFIILLASFGLFLFLVRTDRSAALDSLKNKLAIAFISLLVSMPFWGPYMYSMLTIGSEAMQNKYYEDFMGNMYMPFTEVSLKSLFFLSGIIYVALFSKKDKISFLLLTLIVSSYVWIFFGYLCTILEIPILFYKTHFFVNYLLAVSSLYALGNLLFSENEFSSFKKYKMGLYAVSAVLLLHFCQSFQNMDPGLKEKGYMKMQRATFEELSEGNYKNKVVLSSHLGYHTLFYFPTYVFHSFTHYAHPAALINQRIAFLTKISATKDSSLLAMAVMNNRFNKVDYLYFDGPENRLTVWIDSFPMPLKEKHLYIPQQVLATRYFSKKEKDGFRIYSVKHQENFLRLAKPDLGTMPLEELTTLCGLLVFFEEALGSDLKDKYKTPDVLRILQQRIQANKSDSATGLQINRIRTMIEEFKTLEKDGPSFDQKAMEELSKIVS